MTDVVIWHEGTEETVTEGEFVKRWEVGGIPPGALARLGMQPSFTTPREVIEVLDLRNALRAQARAQELENSNLQPCPACGRQVSKEALTCPQCGHPFRVPIVRAEKPQGAAGNVIAAIASFLIPGLGQLAQGRIGAALVCFFVSMLLWIVLLGWIVHIVAAVEAACWKRQASCGKR